MALIVVVLVVSVWAQQAQPGPPLPASTPAAQSKPAAPVDPKKEQLKADSAKLAKAAAELKAMLNKTDVNTMSLEVIKKAQEVQQLAKQVQKEMKER